MPILDSSRPSIEGKAGQLKDLASYYFPKASSHSNTNVRADPLPEWINPIFSHSENTLPLTWNMSKSMNTITIPPDVLDLELHVFPAFVPDMPQINVCFGQEFKYSFLVGAPRTSMTNSGAVVSVAGFLTAIEDALRTPLDEGHWEAILFIEKVALVQNMASRLGVPYPRIIGDAWGRKAVGSIKKAGIANAVEVFARDPRTGKLRVAGVDYLRANSMFDGISWDATSNEFKVHTKV